MPKTFIFLFNPLNGPKEITLTSFLHARKMKLMLMKSLQLIFKIFVSPELKA